MIPPGRDEHLTSEERAAVLEEWKREERRARPSAAAPLRSRRPLRIAFVCIGAATLLLSLWGLQRASKPVQTVDPGEPHFIHAQELDGEKHYSEAKKEYREALRLTPDNLRYRRALAEMLTVTQQWPEAETEYRALLQRDPNQPYYSALYHERLGDALHQNWFQTHTAVDPAEAEYREAVRLEPRNAEYQHNLGEACYWNSKFQEAEAAYREAVRRKPGTAEYIWDLGNALNHQQKNDEAEAAYREAIRLAPAEGSYPMVLGNFLFRQGKYARAQKEYEEALRIEGEHPTLYCYLADALLHQGHRDEAIQAARKAIDIAYSLGDTDFEGEHKVLQVLGLHPKKLR